VSSVDDQELRRLARTAGEGDSAALERVVAGVRDDVYRLALRMLWHPDDAEDATQEALIRIMTRIGSYRGEAAFRTWAYRVAANHILNWRQSRVEQENLNFRRYGEQLREGLAEPGSARPDADLLAEEVKLGCTLGMLLCLDRDHRLAYVLSDVFDIASSDAAFICSITPAAFRKRASRARSLLREFVGVHCGLVNKSAECRCDRRMKAAIRSGRVEPDDLRFTSQVDPTAAVGEMERLHDLASLMRSHPDYQAPERVTAAIRRVIKSEEYKLLE
jgi:RNA polymerase sigma factor (sigma-70 family)